MWKLKKKAVNILLSLRIMNNIRSARFHALGRSLKIIVGDFNAWAIKWGSRASNSKGRAGSDAMVLLDLVLLNDGFNTAVGMFQSKETCAMSQRSPSSHETTGGVQNQTH